MSRCRFGHKRRQAKPAQSPVIATMADLIAVVEERDRLSAQIAALGTRLDLINRKLAAARLIMEWRGLDPALIEPATNRN